MFSLFVSDIFLGMVLAKHSTEVFHRSDELVGQGMKNLKNRLVLYIAIFATITFGITFAYNIYGHIGYLRDGQMTQENTIVMQEIFEEKLLMIHNELVVTGEKPAINLTAIDTATDNYIPNPITIARELTGNPDIIAYIFIEGTNIEGIVLQGEDNEFYLNRDMYKRQNANGSIFMDYQNSSDFSDRSTIIYAHNMRNGNMFHDLQFFMQSEFLENHMFITVLTETNVLTYEIFSSFITRIDFEYIQTCFVDDYAFRDFIYALKNRAVYNTEALVEVHDRLILLSTCTGTHQDMRYVVAGRLVRVDEL